MKSAAAPAMSETAFLAQVLELAELLGWEGVHFRGAWTARGYRTPVQGSLGKGWPDVVLVRARDHRVLYRELKTDGGHLSPDQERVLEVLKASGCDAGVWRPRDFDAIAKVLQ